MAKHSTIYPSSEDLEAVQSLVSTVECALKHVSDWMDQTQASQSNQSNSSSTQEDTPETEASADESPEGSTKWVHPGKINIIYWFIGSTYCMSLFQITLMFSVVCLSEDSSSSSSPSEGRVLCGVMRIGLVAKGLLIKDDMDLELVLMCREKPTKTLLCTVCDNLPLQIEVTAHNHKPHDLPKYTLTTQPPLLQEFWSFMAKYKPKRHFLFTVCISSVEGLHCGTLQLVFPEEQEALASNWPVCVWI